MINNIKKLIKENRTILQNLSYLSIVQVFNMMLPLITYPYLIRVLGKEVYGLIVFAQTIIGYLVILIAFGFNISATKEISVNRDNKVKLSEIISSTLSIKFGFLFFSFCLLYVLLSFIPEAKGFETLFYLTMWMCLYDFLFPIWYFQGIEKMKYVTIITLTSRLIFLILIFVFIHSPKDFLLLPIINGVGALLSGVISMYIIFINHKLSFRFQNFRTLKRHFNGSIPIFLSNFSGSLYINTNKTLVGLFLGMGEVAYYDLGEKIINIFKIPQGVLGQVIFPKISKEKNLSFVKKIFNVSVSFNLCLYLLLIYFSTDLILILGGEEMLPSHGIVIVLGITIPIVAISNIFGVQLLIPFGYSKQFTRVILSSCLLYLFQISFLWIFDLFTIYSVAFVTVITEIVVAINMYNLCRKNKLWKKNTITSS